MKEAAAVPLHRVAKNHEDGGSVGGPSCWGSGDFPGKFCLVGMQTAQSGVISHYMYK